MITHASPSFPTARALARALAAGQVVTVERPHDGPPPDGLVTIVGPSWPKEARWYARAIVSRDRVIALSPQFEEPDMPKLILAGCAFFGGLLAIIALVWSL